MKRRHKTSEFTRSYEVQGSINAVSLFTFLFAT